jgi:hypothetical protein
MRCRTVVAESAPVPTESNAACVGNCPPLCSEPTGVFLCSVGMHRRNKSCHTVTACMARSLLVVWRLPEKKPYHACIHSRFTEMLRFNQLKEKWFSGSYEETSGSPFNPLHGGVRRQAAESPGGQPFNACLETTSVSRALASQTPYGSTDKQNAGRGEKNNQHASRPGHRKINANGYKEPYSS